MKYSSILILFLLLLLFSTSVVLGAEFELPEGDPITFESIKRLLEMVYDFFVGISILVAMGTLLVSGLMWATAGDSARVEKAKGLLTSGIIGSLIILGVGVIIRTVDYILFLIT